MSSTLATRSGRAGTGILALVTSFLVVLSGLFVAPAAFAADGATGSASGSAAVTVADTSGLTVQVDFSNIPESQLPMPQNMGVYGALVEAGTSTPLGGGSWVQLPQMPGGTGTVSFKTLVSEGLDRAKAYEALIWYAHGNPTPEAIVMHVPVSITSEQWNAIFPPAVPEPTTVSLSASASTVELGADVALTASVAPAVAGAVTFTAGGSPIGEPQQVSNGAATVTISTLTVGTHEIVASFVPADPSAFAASTSEAVTVSVTEPVTPEVPSYSPKVSVFAADGVTPIEASTALYTGDEIVVKGTGFDPTSNIVTGRPPITAGDAGGNYVVFGNFAAAWQPSTGALATTRVVGDQKWAMTDATYNNIDPRYVGAVKGQRVALAADGSFEAKLTLKDIPADKTAPEGGSYGVFTYAAGGATNTAQELELRLNYKGEKPSYSPKVSVFAADGVTPVEASTALYTGDEIVVKGTGFDPTSNIVTGRPPITAGDAGGNYVVFGNFASAWKPSAGALSSTRVVGDQKWAMTDATYGNIDPRYVGAVKGQRVALAADGSFEAKLTLKDIPADKTAPEGGSYGVFTYAAGGPVNAAQELELRLNYKGEKPVGGEFTPELSVFLADGTTPYTGQELVEGDKLVVRGVGFDPYANKSALQTGGVPIPNALPQGTFVVFGNFAEEWQPSQGAPISTRAHDKASRAWLLAADTLNQVPNGAAPNDFRDQIRGQWVELDPTTGAFEASITLHSPSAIVQNGKFGIYTYAGGSGQITNAEHELSVELNYKGDSAPEPEVPEAAVGGLEWAFSTGWNFYAKHIAEATITATNGATVDGQGNANYTQVKGGNFDKNTGVGSIHYQGIVRYVSELHGFDIALKNPQITFTSKSTATMTAELSNSDTGGVSDMTRVTMAILTPGVSAVGEDELLTWANVPGVFAESIQPEGWVDYAGKEIAPLKFTYGSEKSDIPVDPETPTNPPKPTDPGTPTPAPKPATPSQQAGALSWGVSSGFAAYVTGSISKGSISTNGVGSSGGGYLFPQANGGSWNKETQTGSVQFSGVVTYSGHKGLMTETFANPVITVTSATAATLTVGGRTFGLNLGAASKSVGANGEVTWSGVPVSGTISGGGSAGGAAGSGSFSADPLSFTVGVASGIRYGSTSQTEQKPAREAAATPPATDGITVITPAEDLVPGGEIEFESEGFESNERDILVVLYSDPIVLDRKAGANADGKVTWIGTLPADLEPGKHTLTLQGSKNAGAVITVVDPKAAVVSADTLASSSGEQRVAAASAGMNAGPVWLWWIGAGALVALGGATAGLLVLQRRRNSLAEIAD